MSFITTPDVAVRSSLAWLRESTAELQGPALVALIYFLGAEAAFYIGTLSDQIFALFWPPNVVLFCALLLAPQRRWWLYIAAAFPAHVIAELGVGMPAPQLLVAFATNCMVALLNAYGVRRFVGDPPWFGTLHKASLYIVIAAGVSPALSAFGGAFVPILGGGSVSSYWIYWAHWYVANALPNLTIGPVFLIWFANGTSWSRWIPSRRHIEPAVLTALLLGACIVATQVGGLVASAFLPVLLFLPLPLVLWAAVRYGEKGASGAILVVTVVLTWRTLHGSGLLLDADPERSVLALQLFLTGLAIPVLLLGALIDELRGAENTMRSFERRTTSGAGSRAISTTAPVKTLSPRPCFSVASRLRCRHLPSRSCNNWRRCFSSRSARCARFHTSSTRRCSTRPAWSRRYAVMSMATSSAAASRSTSTSRPTSSGCRAMPNWCCSVSCKRR